MIEKHAPKFIYVLCVLLGAVWWIILFSVESRMDTIIKTLYTLFLPLTAAPYFIWAIYEMGKEPEKYSKRIYDESVSFWLTNIIMMVMGSVLFSFIGLVIMGAIVLIVSLFR